MSKTRAALCALLAAAFYAVNVPLSKLLLVYVGPTTMASLLYLGAGLGIGLMSLLNHRRGERLSGRELAGCAVIFAAVLLVQLPRKSGGKE